MIQSQNIALFTPNIDHSRFFLLERQDNLVKQKIKKEKWMADVALAIYFKKVTLWKIL